MRIIKESKHKGKLLTGTCPECDAEIECTQEEATSREVQILANPATGPGGQPVFTSTLIRYVKCPECGFPELKLAFPANPGNGK